MIKRIVAIIIGIGLIVTGIVLAAPILINLLGAFLKGYGLSWTGKEFMITVIGGALFLAGFITIFIGLAKKAVFWLSLLGVFLFIMGAGGYLSYQQVMQSLNDRAKEAAVTISPENGIAVEIPLNSNTSGIADILKEKGVIKYPFVFKLLSKINGYDGTYQAGTHIVSANLNYDRLMRILSSKPESITVTIPEGLTFKQTVDILVKKKLVNREDFNRTADTGKFDYKFLQGVPQRQNRLEGYLFPDTYEFSMKADSKEVITKLLDNFNRKFTENLYKEAQAKKLSVDKVIILASIVEREAKDSEDRRMIADVFLRRLASKDPTLRKLQSCATIQYIFLNKNNEVKQTITTKDTEIDDPYNTYKYEGLPPGPICSPGLDSIEAVLDPIKNDNWYFVARGDGTTDYSKTYKDQVNKMKKYGVLK